MKTIEIEYPHPGKDLKSIIDEMHLTQSEVAHRTGLPASRISELIQGRRSVTAEYSIRLGRLFRQDDSFWLNLQKEYDLRRVLRKKGAKIDQDVVPLGV